MNSKDKKFVESIPILVYDEQKKKYVLPSFPLVEKHVAPYVPPHERVEKNEVTMGLSPIQSYNYNYLDISKTALKFGLWCGGFALAPIPSLFLAAMWCIPNIPNRKTTENRGAEIVIPRERDYVAPHERVIEREKIIYYEREKEVYRER
jgi:hypothetical protein